MSMGLKQKPGKEGSGRGGCGVLCPGLRGVFACLVARGRSRRPNVPHVLNSVAEALGYGEWELLTWGPGQRQTAFSGLTPHSCSLPPQPWPPHSSPHWSPSLSSLSQIPLNISRNKLFMKSPHLQCIHNAWEDTDNLFNEHRHDDSQTMISVRN